MQADADSMRSLLSTPGYELSFSLLNPQPEVLNAEWDIAQAVKGITYSHSSVLFRTNNYSKDIYTWAQFHGVA